MKNKLVLIGLIFVFFAVSKSYSATYYVSKTGSGNTCSASSPCSSIATGIGKMASGDVLVIGDGTYTEAINGMPSGTSSAYTTIRAQNDWGVMIDGSGWANNYLTAINIISNYVKVQGFKTKMSQAATTNQSVSISGNYNKVIRCSGSYNGTSDNVATFNMGGDHNLFEECYGYGGARYQFLIYWATNSIVRRCVARNDYWNGSLQSAGFVNYDSTNTVWENNIAIDSNTANLGGSGYFGGFWNENKTDHANDTTEYLYGNIILNIRSITYGAGVDDCKLAGTRIVQNEILWDSDSGYWAAYENGNTPSLIMSNLTMGATTGTYDPNNGGAADGTGVSVTSNMSATVQNSLLLNNHSYGLAGYLTSDYNAFYGNGATTGGSPKPSIGSHSLTLSSSPIGTSIKYLPRIESGSQLSTAGSGSRPIGAEIIYQTGVSGTLYGETGYDTLTSTPLWPFPNEAVIKADMASYNGKGGVGTRGFCTTSKQLNGTDTVTLTSYIWEYLGYQMPSDIYNIKSIELPGAPLLKIE
jgi:hypothetical protein